MNHSQRRYALSRIGEIEKTALATIDKKYRTPAVFLSWDQKIDLINAHKVKLKTNLSPYTDVCKAFDFSAYEKPEKVDEVKRRAAYQKAQEAFKLARDEIALGGAAEGLAMLQKLERTWLKQEVA